MRRALVICCLFLAARAATARADGDVGVVVTGDNTMQPQVLALVETWLRSHGHQLVASPLPPEATNKLIDCFVIEDTSCARKVVERQAKTATVVFARVDVSDSAGGMRDATITAYWFERGSEPVAEKRSCEKCTDATLRTTFDALMSALAGTGRKVVGQLELTSTPAGATVTIDGVAAGTTPLKTALAPGEHRLTIAGQGGPEVTRTVTIVQGQTAPLAVELRPEIVVAHPRPKLPLALMAGGGALLLTGIVVYATSETDTGETYRYRDTRALGLAVGAGGLVLGGIGTYLWITAGRRADSAPSVAITPRGAYVGWGRTF